MTDSAGGVDAGRTSNFFLAVPEQRVMTTLARRMPRWVLPDDLTILGLVSSVGICLALAASSWSTAWLWLVCALLVVHWLADSLDGNLARERKITRPRYGFYLDHAADAVSTTLIGVGLGLSPFMTLWVGVLVVVAYLTLSINVYLESMALNKFSIGYGRVGPTEIRLILLTVCALLGSGVNPSWTVAGTTVAGLDVVGLVVVAGMFVMVAARAMSNLRQLAQDEPAARRR